MGWPNMKKCGIIQTIGNDAFVCNTCGEIRPVKDPTYPWCLAFERNEKSSRCYKCGQEAPRVSGEWSYYDVKKGIWPFRKVERHWEFTENGIPK